jgi:hypothetical protein
MHGYPAVTGRQRLAALVVVMSLELVELAHVQVLEMKLHRRLETTPLPGLIFAA